MTAKNRMVATIHVSTSDQNQFTALKLSTRSARNRYHTIVKAILAVSMVIRVQAQRHKSHGQYRHDYADGDNRTGNCLRVLKVGYHAWWRHANRELGEIQSLQSRVTEVHGDIELETSRYRDVSEREINFHNDNDR